MKDFRNTRFFGICCLLMLFIGSQAFAHPYASGITNSSGTIYYILNESADDVKVAFDRNTTTNDLGAQGMGVHTFSLGAHTNYSIIVSKAASGAPFQISVDSALTDFYGVRGVSVNRNPRTRNFGRTYIVNTAPGTDGVRTTQKGAYVLNADQSDALGYGATAYPPTGTGANQIQYGSSTLYSPYKVFVGPDDSVYIADASGALGVGTTVGGGVSMAGPDLTTVTDLFTFNGTTTGAGLVCAASTPFVTGSVASNNLVLYTVEWNRTPYNNLWKYQMNNGPFPFTSSPVQLASAGISNVNQVLPDLYIAPDGKFVTCEHRSSATGGNVTLRIFATDGLTPLWDSSSAGGGTDPFFNSYCVAISPDDQYIAVGNNSGSVYLCQLTNGIPNLATFSTVSAGLGGVCDGVAFDAADNLYAVGGPGAGNNLLRAFSLGLGTVNTTSNDVTGTNGTFVFSVGNTNTPPVIGTQPQSQSVLIGSSATFTVSSGGAVPLSYQWQLNGANLSDNTQILGSLSNTLVIPSVASSNAGNFRVIVTNAYGAATSSVAVLTPLSIPIYPVGWSQFPNSPGPNNVRHDDVSFTDPTNGWASQNNLIYRTTNGGYTWTTNLNMPGTHFRSVCFATPLVGFGGNLGVGSYDGGVTDTNVMYKSTDGGVTWSNVPGFAEAGMKGLCAMFVLDSQHIYGAGRVRGPAYFIKSTNGGGSWTITSLTASNVMNGIMDVYFSDPTNGWVVGMDTNAYSSPPYYGRIARTTNGGTTWNTVITTPISNSYFWKISFPSANVGYVALQQNASFNSIVFYKTTDGGNTWVSNGIPLSSVGLGTSGFYLQGLGFVSTNEGWIGGASGLSSYTNSFLHTVDGGATWTSIGFNNTFFINRIRFLNPNLGFASGANVYVYNQPVVITSQSSNQVGVGGSNLNLSVAATSLYPVTYQWLFNGTNISSTNSFLSLTNIKRNAEGVYSVSISNAAGGLISSNITVRIITAERLGPPMLLPGGQLQLLFNDADGGALLTTNDIATFQVLVSTNLNGTWSVLTNSLTLTNGSMLLRDTWTNSGNRFYRVLEH